MKPATVQTVRVNREVPGEYLTPGTYAVEVGETSVHFRDLHDGGGTWLTLANYRRAVQSGAIAIQ